MTTAALRAITAPPSSGRRALLGRLATSSSLPLVALGLIVVLWGSGPPVMKLISAPALSVAFARLWMGVPIMFAIQRASGLPITWPTVRRSFWGGLFFGVNMACMFNALNHASIATITVIAALQPGVMVVAGPLLGERVGRRALAWTAVATAGAAVAVLGAGASVHTSVLGVALSLATLISLSLYFLASKRARATLPSSQYIAGVMFWAAVVVTPVAALSGGFGGLGAIGAGDLGWMVLILAGPGVVGHLLMSWAVRMVPLSLSSMTMLGTTIVSILLAWPIHHQPVTVVQALGGALALLGVARVVRTPAPVAA